jgi:hypothetical protein
VYSVVRVFLTTEYTEEEEKEEEEEEEDGPRNVGCANTVSVLASKLNVRGLPDLDLCSKLFRRSRRIP